VHGAGLVGGSGPALAIASARNGPERKLKVVVTERFCGPPELFWSASDTNREIFSDCSRRFPINRGGGELRNFFRNFFLRFFGGGGGGRGAAEGGG
jgi:hypothetical protein